MVINRTVIFAVLHPLGEAFFPSGSERDVSAICFRESQRPCELKPWKIDQWLLGIMTGECFIWPMSASLKLLSLAKLSHHDQYQRLCEHNGEITKRGGVGWG